MVSNALHSVQSSYFQSFPYHLPYAIPIYNFVLFTILFLFLSTFQPFTKLYTTYSFHHFPKVTMFFMVLRTSSGCTVFIFIFLAVRVYNSEQLKFPQLARDLFNAE